MSLNRLLGATVFLLTAVQASAQDSPQVEQLPAEEAPAPSTGLGMFESSSQFTLEQITATHLRLTGEVEMEGNGVKFFADEVDYHTDTNKIIARGNVVFTNAEGSISADRVEFNASTGLGTFYEAAGILSLGPGVDPAQFGGLDPEVYFYGQILEKTGTRQYRLTRGGFSACVQPTPRWEVTSNSVVLNLDEYAMARNTILRVKGVPVLYLPILYYPIKDGERATGFLMPSYGASTLRGQTLSNAFFWAINRSQDATFFHDWFTRTGQGAGAEYRYVAGPRSRGDLRFYHFSQKETEFTHRGRTTLLPKQTSYEFSGSLTQNIGNTLRARGRVDYFSDVTTQQLYQQDIYQASQQSRIIEGGLSGTFGRLQTSALFQRNELFSGESNVVVYGNTPRASANLAQTQLFGSPIYGSFTSEFAYQPYRYLTDNVVTRDDSRALFQFAPEVRVPLSRLTYLSVNTSATYRSTYYSRSLDEDGTRENVPFVRQFVSLQSQVIGPVFNRIFNTENGFAERLKHVIEPTFSVSYAVSLAESTRQPLVVAASDSAIGGSAQFTYGVVNRFFSRAPTVNNVEGVTREFLTIELRQTRYTNPLASSRDTTYASPSQNLLFSPIQLMARFSPAIGIETTTRLAYDVSTGHGLKLFTSSGTISTEPLTSTVSYSWSRPTPISATSTYLSTSTSARFHEGRTTGTYGLSWDIARRYIVSQSVSAVYMAQCCGLQFEFQNYSFPRELGFPIPSDRRFNIAVVLAGLGTFSNFFGAFGG
jgi:LPS-assembly protein